MGYVSDLRSLLGTRPLILVGSEVLVIDSQDRLLVTRRSDNGLWSIPGGMMEPGETLEETARREVSEETGMLCHKLEFFKMYSGPQFYYRYPHGDEVFNVSAVFVCRSFTGEIQIDSESLEIGFYSLNALPQTFTQMNKIVIDDYFSLHPS